MTDHIAKAQRVLAATSYYAGRVDGDLGPQTQVAIKVIERTQGHRYAETPNESAWVWTRRLYAAAQAALAAWKFNVGTVDGYWGHVTDQAYEDWRGHAQGTRKTRAPQRRQRKGFKSTDGTIPLQSQIRKYYGTPGKHAKGPNAVRNQLTRIELPFYMRLDWALGTKINKITVHEKAAPSLRSALIEAYEHYGAAKFKSLGLDRFAGSYNPRRMRGGSKWSMHAYGCAIDIYAAPNGLRARCPEALFCKPEYKDFLDIMQKHGWLPAIRLWGADAMHFQRARLK